jgi:outer membrane lipoprotein carrier protein
MVSMRSSALGVLLAVLSTGGLTASQAPGASDLAARIQARFATVRDFSADFTQTETSPLLPRPLTERGQLKVKKPGKMRWTYTSGDRKVFVSDGVRAYMHYPQDRYVEEFKVTEDDSTGLLFLAGRVDLVKDFTSSVPAVQPEGVWRVVLKPKKRDADLSSLAIDVERTSLAIRAFTITDAQDSVRTFTLSKLQENRNLPDADFAFVMPKNVELRRQ